MLIWEVLNGTLVEYTYVCTGIGARLDRIYVSKNLKDSIRSAQVNVNSFSDHKTYMAVINLPYLGERLGYESWRFKCS
jgi:hypothetical protein